MELTDYDLITFFFFFLKPFLSSQTEFNAAEKFK